MKHSVRAICRDFYPRSFHPLAASSVQCRGHAEGGMFLRGPSLSGCGWKLSGLKPLRPGEMWWLARTDHTFLNKLETCNRLLTRKYRYLASGTPVVLFCGDLKSPLQRVDLQGRRESVTISKWRSEQNGKNTKSNAKEITQQGHFPLRAMRLP